MAATKKKIKPHVYYKNGVPFCGFNKAELIPTTCHVCGKPMLADTVTWQKDKAGFDKKVKLSRIRRIHGGECYWEWKKLSAAKKLKAYETRGQGRSATLATTRTTRFASS